MIEGTAGELVGVCKRLWVAHGRKQSLDLGEWRANR